MADSIAYTLEKLQPLLHAASDQTRLRLLYLCSGGEYTVSELVAVLGQSQPRVSRHLKILCDVGLLERFRDGHWVYFRAPQHGVGAQSVARVLAFLDTSDQTIQADAAQMKRVLQADSGLVNAEVPMTVRRLHRLMLEQFLSLPVGELLDIGVGNGGTLKLLASRASSAHGVDIDSASRQVARRAVALAALNNCTVRPGDMYRLSFDDSRFDTVVLDEVLLSAERPPAALTEAVRVMKPGGHMLIVEHVAMHDADESQARLTQLLAESPLRCGLVRSSNDGAHKFLVTMAFGDADVQHRKQAQ
ncbi:MAG: metalloregulator ArsR/SmtB family transcription factor [Pseudomonadota bacterium]